MKRDEEPPLEYLLDCSKAALQAIHLRHRNRAANCRKDVQNLLNEWVETAAMALLTEWFELYGEKLIALAGEAKERPEAVEEIFPLPIRPPIRRLPLFNPPHRKYSGK